MKFKYKDKVKITKGFYRGQQGYVTGFDTCFFKRLEIYYVKYGADVDGGQGDWFDDFQLELVKK